MLRTLLTISIIFCSLSVLGFAQEELMDSWPKFAPYGNPQADQSVREWEFSLENVRYQGIVTPKRFLSVDRFANKYPHHSPYIYSANNPVLFIDVNGDSAWAITNHWSDKMIQKYREYASQRSKEYANSGVTCTCEDFALNILIDFAELNGLPISIVNGQGTFSAASDQFNNVADFRNAILTSTGARDLQNSQNTSGVMLHDTNVGDMLLVRSNGRTVNHVQLVTSMAENSVGIHQGNSGILNSVPGASKFLDASNPRSWFYTGVPVQTGTWSRKGDYSRDGVITPQAYKKFNLIAKRWNFKKW